MYVYISAPSNNNNNNNNNDGGGDDDYKHPRAASHVIDRIDGLSHAAYMLRALARFRLGRADSARADVRGAHLTGEAPHTLDEAMLATDALQLLNYDTAPAHRQLDRCLGDDNDHATAPMAVSSLSSSSSSSSSSSAAAAAAAALSSSSMGSAGASSIGDASTTTTKPPLPPIVGAGDCWRVHHRLAMLRRTEAAAELATSNVSDDCYEGVRFVSLT